MHWGGILAVLHIRRGEKVQDEMWDRRKWASQMVEKLKQGPASPKDFMNMSIPERSVYQTLKVLKEGEMISQKERRGDYFLPGYESGSPYVGKQTPISLNFSNDYLSWGWKFIANLDRTRVIVEYHPGLPWRPDES